MVEATKRKAAAAAASADALEPELGKSAGEPIDKRARRKDRQARAKRRKIEQGLLDDTDDVKSKKDTADVAVVATPATQLDPAGQSDIFAKLLRDTHPKLSSIELDERTIPGRSFVDTHAFSQSRGLDALCGFVENYTERESVASSNKEPGRPHTLVLAASAIRVADLNRQLRRYRVTAGDPKKRIEVAKLFGKEKLADQAAFLEKNRISVACGVPARCNALVQQGALRLTHVERVVIDVSYLDSKKRSILTIKEVAADLTDFLAQADLLARLRDTNAKIVLY